MEFETLFLHSREGMVTRLWAGWYGVRILIETRLFLSNDQSVSAAHPVSY
jgi:hypothetical protein